MFWILLRNVYLLIAFTVAANAAIIAYNGCTNPHNEKGICIQIIDCGYFYNLLNKNGMNPDDEKFLEESQCGEDNTQTTLDKQILVCCPNHYRNTSNIVVARRAGKETAEPGNILPEPGKCGKVLSNRIHGGNVTKIDEFPWMALLRYKTAPDTYNFSCGGSLINSRYILTAAHCVKLAGAASTWELYSVRLGEWNLTTNPDYTEDTRGRREYVDPYKEVLVDYALVHPLYVPESNDQFNDIALVRMAESVTSTFFIIPICLPIDEHLRTKSFTSTVMDVAGWGHTENNVPSSIKLKIMVDIWNITKCQNTYRSFNLPISESYQMCAGGVNGIDTCRGDSGGALMTTERVNKRDVYFVFGIVSYGPRPCGLPGWPGVYARVSSYTDWIVNNILP